LEHHEPRIGAQRGGVKSKRQIYLSTAFDAFPRFTFPADACESRAREPGAGAKRPRSDTKRSPLSTHDLNRP
jgi:hypothetical protein